ncbi:unnamed protein product [Prunus armeniaca]
MLVAYRWLLQHLLVERIVNSVAGLRLLLQFGSCAGGLCCECWLLRGPNLSCTLILRLNLDQRQADVLSSTLLSFSLVAHSCSTYMGPLKLHAGAFVQPSIFAFRSKDNVSDQVNLVKELPNQVVLVVHFLSQLVNSKTEVYLTSWIRRRKLFLA